MHLSKTGEKNKYLVGIHENYKQKHTTQNTRENVRSKENCRLEPNMSLEGSTTYETRSEEFLRPKVTTQVCKSLSTALDWTESTL